MDGSSSDKMIVSMTNMEGQTAERWEKEIGWTAYHIGRKALYMMRASSSSSEGSASRKTRLQSIGDISLAEERCLFFHQ